MLGSSSRAHGSLTGHSLLLRGRRDCPGLPNLQRAPRPLGSDRSQLTRPEQSRAPTLPPAIPLPAGEEALRSAITHPRSPALRRARGAFPGPHRALPGRGGRGWGKKGGSAAGPVPAEGPALLPDGVWRLPAPGALASGSVWRRRRGGEPVRRNSSLRPCSVSSSTTPSWAPKRERYRSGASRPGAVGRGGQPPARLCPGLGCRGVGGRGGCLGSAVPPRGLGRKPAPAGLTLPPPPPPPAEHPRTKAAAGEEGAAAFPARGRGSRLVCLRRGRGRVPPASGSASASG